MFSLCIDVPNGASYCPQNIMPQFYICYHKIYYATLMLLEKLCFMKTNKNFRDQVWNKPSAKSWVKDFILLRKYQTTNFYQRFCHT